MGTPTRWHVAIEPRAPKRIPIQIRVAPDVLAKLRAEASRRHVGYQTLIHAILKEYTAGKKAAA